MQIRIPTTAYEFINVASIVIFLPVAALLCRHLANREVKITTRNRMIVGFLFACASLASAAVIESVRLGEVQHQPQGISKQIHNFQIF